MKTILLRRWGLAWLLALAMFAVPMRMVRAESLPARDFVLELREIQSPGGGYVVGTAPQAALMPPQRLQVHNGQQARLTFMQSTPIQWTVNAGAGSFGRSAQSSGTGGGSTGTGQNGAPPAGNWAAAQQGLIWIQAGQSLAFRPRWNGGHQPVLVDVEVQTARPQAQPEGGLPAQQHGELQTVVQAPLGEWVTLAQSGRQSPQGTYRSDAADERPRMLQLRVSLP